MRQIQYSEDGTPIQYSMNVDRSDNIRFHDVRRKKWKPAGLVQTRACRQGWLRR